MRRLSVYNSVTLDGFFKDLHNDMSWAHQTDPEWNEFVAGNASGDPTLLFGCVTYELMASYWPTPMATRNSGAVAERMNKLQKIVFSRALTEASWSNTRLLKSDLVAEVHKLKNQPGEDIVIFGSGSIVSQLTQARLIDEYQIALNPTILGGGKTLFEGLKELTLKLTKSRAFRNGNVFLCYEPAA